MREAMAIDPRDSRLRRMLATSVFYSRDQETGLKLLQDAVKQFPGDTLCWYDLGLYHDFAGHHAEALAAYREAVKRQPIAGAYIVIAELLEIEGNLAGADAAVKQIPVQNRSDDRAVAVVMWLGIMEDDCDRVVAASRLTTTDYFNDAHHRGPKAAMLALAYNRAGKQALATLEWDEAIQLLRARLQNQPTDFDRVFLAIALAWRGLKPEAAAIVATIEPAQREMTHPTLDEMLAEYYAALGDAPMQFNGSNLRPTQSNAPSIGTGRYLGLKRSVARPNSRRMPALTLRAARWIAQSRWSTTSAARGAQPRSGPN